MEIKETMNNNDLDDFKFILARSDTIDKIKLVDNKVKEINYTYSSESDFSDEILYYLTQKIDKINQYKYNLLLLNLSSRNFIITNVNFTTEIDVINQYAFIKNQVHYNQKAFNVHEHRKIPYEEENRQNFRRRFHDNSFANNYNHNLNKSNNNYNRYNKRNASVDVSHRYKKEENKKNIGERNNNFRNNHNNNYNLKRENRNYSNEERRNSENQYKRGFVNKNKNSYNNELTTYNPFIRNSKKNLDKDD